MLDHFFEDRSHGDIAQSRQRHAGVGRDARQGKIRPIGNDVDVADVGDLLQSVFEFQLVERNLRDTGAERLFEVLLLDIQRILAGQLAIGAADDVQPIVRVVEFPAPRNRGLLDLQQELALLALRHLPGFVLPLNGLHVA